MSNTARVLSSQLLTPHHLLHIMNSHAQIEQEWRVTMSTLHKNYPFPSHPSPPLRLTLALGTTEELPGCSCKVIKEALTAHWFRPPQSGVYWVTLEEGCGSGHQDRAVKVGPTDTGIYSQLGSKLAQDEGRRVEEGLLEPSSHEVHVPHIAQHT